MARARRLLQEKYGSSGLHLLVTAGSLVLAAYVVVELGVGELWDADVWWQSILVWFLGSVLLHDLVLFPFYALADHLLRGFVHRREGARGRTTVPVVNYVRVPVLAIGLLFLLFFPGIIEQGASSHLRATGQTQDPFLERWLVLSAVIVGLSALCYAARVSWARRSARSRGGDSTQARADEPSVDP